MKTARLVLLSMMTLLAVSCSSRQAEQYAETESLGQSARPLECTPDLNPWGNPSACNCPAGSSYDAKRGLCAVTTSTQPLACTPDVNQWGNSSACQCPEGQSYNPQKGVCAVSAKEHCGSLSTKTFDLSAPTTYFILSYKDGARNKSVALTSESYDVSERLAQLKLPLPTAKKFCVKTNSAPFAWAYGEMLKINDFQVK